jgi:nucleotide-binding universal stress UspA family protein
MNQYKKILVPLDGSQVAEAVLPEVETVAKAFAAKIMLIRAYYTHAFPGADPTKAQVAATKEAEDYLRAIEKQLKTKGLDVDSHTAYEADAAKAILDHSARHHIDLIMMSTHGRGAIGHYLLGSVAEKVVHHSTKPVFLIRSAK